jgi:hypothetical protein
MYSLSSLFPPTVFIRSRNNIMLQLKLEAGLKTTGETKARLPRNHHGCCVLHTERRKEESGGETRPVTMAVRLLASTPTVTSSAVDAEPKPDGPGAPRASPRAPSPTTLPPSHASRNPPPPAQTSPMSIASAREIGDETCSASPLASWPLAGI